MNKLSLLALCLASLYASPSHACTNGDGSKVLLVLGEYAGEEQKVVGEIETANNAVVITSGSFYLAKQNSSTILVEDDMDQKFSFRRADAAPSRFCFKAIYGESAN